MVVENNKVYENSWYSRYGCSGISAFTTRNFDNTTGYRNRFTGNIMWNNKGLIPYYKDNKLTDGNGLIFDVDETNVKSANFTATGSVAPQPPVPPATDPTYLLTVTGVNGKILVGDFLSGTGMPAVGNDSKAYAVIVSQVSGTTGGAGVYKINKPSTSNNSVIESWTQTGGYGGRTLIANNLTVNNGGSGIHVFNSGNADVVNNTAYMNGTVMTNYADIFAAYSHDVRLFNNIVYARPGHNINSNNRNTNVSYDYNIYFNGVVAAGTKGANDLEADPQFYRPGLDPSNAATDFRLTAYSPAVDRGLNLVGVTPTVDLRNVSRATGARVDRGAIEFNLVPQFSTPSELTWTVGRIVNFNITAYNYPTQFSADGYQAIGNILSVNQRTGEFRGVPTRRGVYQVTLYARNSVGLASTNITIRVN